MTSKIKKIFTFSVLASVVGGLVLGVLYLNQQGVIADLPVIVRPPVADDVVPVDDSDFITCEEAITLILVDQERLERVDDSDSIIYRRGGYDKNQFTINFTENKFIMGHAIHSYAQFWVDEYFYYRDMSEEIARIRKEMLELLGPVFAIYYGDEKKATIITHNGAPEDIVTLSDNPHLINRFDTELVKIHQRLEAVGCPLKHQSPSILNKYRHQKVSSMAYFEPSELIVDPIDVVMCSGLDCLVSDHPKYVELKNWKDVDKLPHTRVINGVEFNVGKIVVVYDNSRLTRDYIVDPMFHHVYPEETFYKWTINGSSNPTYFQNIWRDVYLDRWRETSPLVYFVDASKAPNRKLTTGEACYSNGYTFYEWSCDWSHAIFEWLPDGDGVTPRPFGWFVSADPHDTDNRLLFEHLNLYADLSDLSPNFIDEYLKIFNLDWQEDFGLREYYFEKFGY